MIESISLLKDNKTLICEYDMPHEYKIEIDSTPFLECKSFSIQIVFNYEIVSFRNYDYEWVNIKKDRLSNWYSPKIIKIANNSYVQANQQNGIWEVKKSQSNVLLWHFNIRYSKPLINYDKNNSKRIFETNVINVFRDSLTLLISKDCGIEVSRSKVPFSAIACFTDHCDFDSLNNLRQQRNFFKQHNIKLTKGFFLNDYSKLNDTACYENHKLEIKEWLDDGHELAYHSLSKSIKPLVDSISDFKSFDPPFENIQTYIDHGFQPYNASLYKNQPELNTNYGKRLKELNINNLWNYIDTGTSVKGVINQINPNQFTLEKFYNGIKHLNIPKRLQLLLKSIVFHYFNNEYSLKLYRSLAHYYKSIKKEKRFKRHILMFWKTLKLFRLLIPIACFWSFRKSNIFPLAKYSPLIFCHQINDENFTVFQTLEMIDFKLGLCKSNLDLLIKEHGIFIAHTYFSAPMNYHQGKLFGSADSIDPQVETNFAYLSQKIDSKEIWNPTLNELVSHFKNIKKIRFDCDNNGSISISNFNEILFREVR